MYFQLLQYLPVDQVSNSDQRSHCLFQINSTFKIFRQNLSTRTAHCLFLMPVISRLCVLVIFKTLRLIILIVHYILLLFELRIMLRFLQSLYRSFSIFVSAFCCKNRTIKRDIFLNILITHFRYPLFICSYYSS